MWEEFSFADVLEQAPWWVVSAVIHLILIILLAAVNFTTIPAKRRDVYINTEFVEVMERERPVTQRNIFDDTSADAENVQQEAQTELENLQVEVPVLRAQPISMNQIAGLLNKGETSFDASGSNLSGLLGKIGQSRMHTVRSVVDALAEEILKEVGKRELLVVMLYDESQSLLEDRRVIGLQLKKTIGDLKKEMTPREAMRLKWSVVSYGDKPTMCLQPTGDLQQVLEATQNVKTDTTGREDLIEALEFVLNTLGKLGKKMFIVVVTDEQGTDADVRFARNRTNVLKILQALKARQARLFVFGREASFQCYTVPEWLRDKNGERLGPWGTVHRGLETCDQEFFKSEWFLIPYWHHIPAGYGCYVQSMLAYQTGGTYFIVSEVPSAYDEEKLENYKPEWDPPDVYEARTKESKLRFAMSTLFKQFKDLTPKNGSWPWLNQLYQLKAQTTYKMEQAKKGFDLVDDAIDRLEGMAGRSKSEKVAKVRWEANYDLTMGELHRLRFLLREYQEVCKDVLRHGYPKPEKGKKFNLFHFYYDYKATEAVSGRRGNRDWQIAKDALNRVADKHDGVPHGDCAKYELRHTVPLYLRPTFYIEPTRPKM